MMHHPAIGCRATHYDLIRDDAKPHVLKMAFSFPEDNHYRDLYFFSLAFLNKPVNF